MQTLNTFDKGMNLDVADHLLPQGFTRIKKNCRTLSTDNGYLGVIQSIKGTELLDQILVNGNIQSLQLPTGSLVYNLVVGSTFDGETDSFIFFLCSIDAATSQPNLYQHTIFRVFTQSGYLERILTSPYLNLQLNNIVYARVFNGLLYWTDNYSGGTPFSKVKSDLYDDGVDEWINGINGLKKLNINKAIQYTRNDYGNVYNWDASIHTYNTGDYCERIGFVWMSTVNGNVSIPGVSLTWQVIKRYNINDEYLHVIPSTIERAKGTHNSPLVAEYSSDSTYHANNLRKKQFQFAIQYVYDDKERTILSSYSNVPIPSNTETLDGNFTEVIEIDNRITLTYNTGDFDVKTVNILAREGNTGDWKIVGIIEKYDKDGYWQNITSNSQNTFYFYNNESGSYVPQEEATRLLSDNPLCTKTFDIAENSIFESNVIQGLDGVTLDVTLTTRYKTIELAKQYNIAKSRAYWSSINCNFIKFQLPLTVRINYTYSITLKQHSSQGGELFTVYYTAQDGDTNQIIGDALIDAINARDGKYVADRRGWSVYYSGIGGFTNTAQDIYVIEDDPTPTSYFNYDECDAGIYINQNKVSHFSNNTNHKLGLVYYDDKDRRCAVNANGDTEIFVPFQTEWYGDTYPYNNYYTYLKWEINHVPPMYATHYQWVYADRQDYTYFQYFYVAKADVTTSGGNTWVYINKDLESLMSDTYKTIVEPYIFVDGDRITLINAPNVKEYEIKNFDDSSDYAVIVDSSLAADVAAITETWVLFKVTRPRKTLADETNIIYKEIGSKIPIYTHWYGNSHVEEHLAGEDDDSGWARQQIVNGSGVCTQSARGVLKYGDVYITKRVGNPASYFVENQSISDFYLGTAISVGRYNTINKNYKYERHENKLVYSGLYLSDSYENNTNIVDPAYYEMFNPIYGEITALKWNGQTLSIYQRDRVTSKYINRAGLAQATMDQGDVVVSSNEFLGTNYIHKSTVGTINPESIVTDNDGNEYFFDRRRKKFYVMTSGGTYDITGGIESYITPIIANVNAALDLRCISYYNITMNEICFVVYSKISFILTPLFTVVYNIKGKNWDYFMELTRYNAEAKYTVGDKPPDYIVSANGYILSWMNGETYHHEATTTYGEFYGEQKTKSVKIIVNENPLSVKTFKSLIEDADEIWDLPTATNIIVQPNQSYPLGMKSMLTDAMFRVENGKMYADFKRNMLTTDVTANVKDLFTGSELRGQVLELTLENDSANFVSLQSIEVNYI